MSRTIDKFLLSTRHIAEISTQTEEVGGNVSGIFLKI